MRNFLLILIFFTNFLSLSKADNIKEFAIEGISIGDSLLDYTSAKKIKDGMLTDYKSNLYSRFTLRDINSKSFKLYDDIQIHFKTNDKNFIIVSMSGGIYNDNEL